MAASAVRFAIIATDPVSGASGCWPALIAVCQRQTGDVLRHADDVADLVVGVHQGKPVYLREVAKVEAGAAQPQRYVWFTPGAADAQAADVQAGQVYPAVTLTVTKKPGENAVDVASAARARLDVLRNTVIPGDIRTTVTRDYGETAAEKANKLLPGRPALMDTLATALAYEKQVPRAVEVQKQAVEKAGTFEVDKVRTATALVRERRPDLLVEGPIQYDAAVEQSVADKKMPDSLVAGKATVFVFPDLNTGNNTYKAVQRSAGAIAVGPVLQGLNKPVNDLSRGALVEDIVNTVAITAIQAQASQTKD